MVTIVPIGETVPVRTDIRTVRILALGLETWDDLMTLSQGVDTDRPAIIFTPLTSKVSKQSDLTWACMGMIDRVDIILFSYLAPLPDPLLLMLMAQAFEARPKTVIVAPSSCLYYNAIMVGIELYDGPGTPPQTLEQGIGQIRAIIRQIDEEGRQ